MRRISPLVLVLVAFLLLSTTFVFADTIIIYLTSGISKTVYGPNETLTVYGIVYTSTQSSAGSPPSVPTAVTSGNVTVNITNSSGSLLSTTYLNLTSSGSFKSYSAASAPNNPKIYAPMNAGTYTVYVSYKDTSNQTWTSDQSIIVETVSIDEVRITPDKATYYAGQAINARIEALRKSSDSFVGVANVSINATLRNLDDSIRGSFGNCKESGSKLTDDNGLCTANITAPSVSGSYKVESNNFLGSTQVKVVPFDVSIKMRDSTGKSLQQLFTTGDSGKIEVTVTFNGTTPSSGVYNFNGTIVSPTGKVVANITTTRLDENNSFSSGYLFTIDTDFPSGLYKANVFVYGSELIATSATFAVRTWSFSFDKATQGSGFQYEYTAFRGANTSFNTVPAFRLNGSLLLGLNVTRDFNITLKDSLGTLVGGAVPYFDSNCLSTGCYIFNMTLPSQSGAYTLTVNLNYSGEAQRQDKIITISDSTAKAVTTNEKGGQQDSFSPSEFVYIQLSGKNSTGAVNVTDAELARLVYESGEVINTTKGVWNTLNVSKNKPVAWAFNNSVIKLTPPSQGGLYTVEIYSNNRSSVAKSTFIFTPYDLCSIAVDSLSQSPNFVWQFRTTDTVYFQLKVTQKQSSSGSSRKDAFSESAPATGTGGSMYGRSSSGCISFSSSQGNSQAVTNATIKVIKVINEKDGKTAKLNDSSTICTAADSSGGYTCTIQPSPSWEAGFYHVIFNITGQDGTIDKGHGNFEARNFYIWAYSSSWINKENESINFTVNMYQPGKGWWGNSGGGMSGTITLEKVLYMGSPGEWLWPPVDAGYNTTGVSSSTITDGRGSFFITPSRMPNGKWKSGSYQVILKGTDDATGNSDYGLAWFEIRRWWAFAMPAELRTNDFSNTSDWNWKDSFNTKDNVSLFVDIKNAGSWNENEFLGGTISIGVKKIEDYTDWPPAEFAKTDYSANVISINKTSNFWGSGLTNKSQYILKIVPTTSTGKWEAGFYNVVLNINGSETGFGWFNVVAFFAQAQVIDSTGNNAWNTKGSEPVSMRITTSKSPVFGTAKPSDLINTTIQSLTLRKFDMGSFKPQEFKYPGDLNLTTTAINGSRVINISKSQGGSWSSGFYESEIVMINSDGDESTARAWYQVQSFAVNVAWTWEQVGRTTNIVRNVTIVDPRNYQTILKGNYTVHKVSKQNWGFGQSAQEISSFSPTTVFNGSTVSLNISPTNLSGGKWSAGFNNLNIIIRNVDTNETGESWLSFEVRPIDVQLQTLTTKVTPSQNASASVTIRDPSTMAAKSGNLTRVFSYDSRIGSVRFKVQGCSSEGNCLITGAANVTIIPPSAGWSEGWMSLETEFTDSDDPTSTINPWNRIEFSVTQVIFGSNYPAKPEFNGGYYDPALNENVTLRVWLYNSTGQSTTVEVTSVQISERDPSCFTEKCRTFTNAFAFYVWNSTNLNLTSGGYLGIAPNGTWKDNEYNVKVTVQKPGSPADSAIIRGYFRPRDKAGPGVNVTSPQVVALVQLPVNGSIDINATTDKKVKCGFFVRNQNKSYFRGFMMKANEEAKFHSFKLTEICDSNLTFYIYCEDKNYNFNLTMINTVVNGTLVDCSKLGGGAFDAEMRVMITYPFMSIPVNTSNVTVTFSTTGSTEDIKGVFLKLDSNADVNVTTNLSIGNYTFTNLSDGSHTVHAWLMNRTFGKNTFSPAAYMNVTFTVNTSSTSGNITELTGYVTYSNGSAINGALVALVPTYDSTTTSNIGKYAINRTSGVKNLINVSFGETYAKVRGNVTVNSSPATANFTILKILVNSTNSYIVMNSTQAYNYTAVNFSITSYESINHNAIAYVYGDDNLAFVRTSENITILNNTNSLFTVRDNFSIMPKNVTVVILWPSSQTGTNVILASMNNELRYFNTVSSPSIQILSHDSDSIETAENATVRFSLTSTPQAGERVLILQGPKSENKSLAVFDTNSTFVNLTKGYYNLTLRLKDQTGSDIVQPSTAKFYLESGAVVITGCSTITLAGTYLLNRSIDGATGICLTINNNGANVNLLGKRIKGQRAQDSIGIFLNRSNSSSVNNGNVSDFERNILALNANNSNITSVQLRNSTKGSLIFNMSNFNSALYNTFQKNDASETNATIIVDGIASSQSVFNKIENNTGTGIETVIMLNNNSINTTGCGNTNMLITNLGTGNNVTNSTC